MYDIHRWLYLRLRRHFFSLAHFFLSLSLSRSVKSSRTDGCQAFRMFSLNRLLLGSIQTCVIVGEGRRRENPTAPN